MRFRLLSLSSLLIAFVFFSGNNTTASPQSQTPLTSVNYYLLKLARIFDGEQLRENWAVLVRG
ncbi:MAG TPA: hypothetical protein PLQ88_29380, partial [Blastocatellia bacterium]|nr:hypothetical protein [Blastocatellia bacterium]